MRSEAALRFACARRRRGYKTWDWRRGDEELPPGQAGFSVKARGFSWIIMQNRFLEGPGRDPLKSGPP